jgi:hypothetical protein
MGHHHLRLTPSFFATMFGCRLKLGLFGLWWGLVITNCIQGTLMLVIASRFDFAKEAALAAARTAAHSAARDGSVDEDGGLLEPLLQGPQCEQLEQGMLAVPADPPA